MAGSTAGFIMYPNDTVRRLLQMQEKGANMQYRSAADCYVQVYKTQGIRRFYRGVGPYLLRMVPNAAIQFGCYESFKQMYHRR
mmetsp:Transcript_5194/g.9892  ORF Transcript_5194/g.9892 Transcript_5194/m.9892 type:complete len:83 (+) Transcript_5194:2-250(+)